MYGFQWRHFGAEYKGMHADYSGQGVDQLAHLISRIKSNPEDRRLILSAWNPTALPDMALPPCHLMCQVTSHNRLPCMPAQKLLTMGIPRAFCGYVGDTHVACCSHSIPEMHLLSVCESGAYVMHIPQRVLMQLCIWGDVHETWFVLQMAVFRPVLHLTTSPTRLSQCQSHSTVSPCIS